MAEEIDETIVCWDEVLSYRDLKYDDDEEAPSLRRNKFKSLRMLACRQDFNGERDSKFM